MRIPHRLTSSPSNLCSHYLEIYGRVRSIRSGKKVHTRLIINGLQHLTGLNSKLINFYIQCGLLLDARQVFDQMPQSNLDRWIILITSFSRFGFHRQTLSLFSQMLSQNLKPNHYILPNIIKACANTFDLNCGKCTHALVIRLYYGCDVFVGTALISFYAKYGWVLTARKVFDQMPIRDLGCWNTVISAYAREGLVTEAIKLFDEMQSMGIRPNMVSWNVLIAGFANVGEGERALGVLREMHYKGIDPDVVSWTSVVSGFVKNMRNEEAFSVFRQMAASGVQPNSATVSSLLPACAVMADSRHGKEIHGYVVVMGLENDVFVGSSLVDMYAKCGFFFEAQKVFLKMPKKNTVSWNSMIFGYANHGFCDEAIGLFEKLESDNEAKPDHLTFTAILTACDHAGNIDFGKKVFNLMQEKYEIVPRLEHYACMVDLLGRAGKLFEAYSFIQRMPVEPDSFVWGALLAACKNHGNVELAKIAASHLFKLEPKSAGSPVLLSNALSEAGRWEDATKLKKIVKKRRLQRGLGCSWIEGA